MRPFIARYSVAHDHYPTFSMHGYDPDRDIAISSDGMSVLEDPAQALALTGSILSKADADPTRDEATDR